ncbi:hypothetical protein, partial [Streptomyces sp. NPDC019937]|uniref:hypothetical protein n=1 Tax=Streptomyces sp. NPDC019937 TaxID=3154787 RepID=UPI0033D73D85
MTARQQLAAAVDDLDPATLSHEQLQGWNCVLCGTHLTVDQPMGTVTVDHEMTRMTCEVWACDPACGVRPAPSESTPWGRFLDHAVGCTDCRAGQRCAAGDGLHHAVREAVAAATPRLGGVVWIMPGSRRPARHLAAPRSSHAAPLRS